MKSLKIIRLLQALEKTELNECRKYIMSKTQTTGSTVLDLYKILRKYYPAFDSRGLDRKKIFHRLFPNTIYSEKKLTETVYKLNLLIEEFLVVKEIRTDPFLKKKLLTQAYGKRNLFTRFEQSTGQLLNQLEKSTVRDMTYYLERINLIHHYFFHPNTIKYQTSTIGIEEIMKGLDFYFSLAKMRYGTELLAHEKILSNTHDIFFMEEVKNNIQTSFSKENPIFNIYLKIIQLYQEGHKKNIYEEGKNCFMQHLEKLSTPEKAIVLQHFLNHTNGVINQGDRSYTQDLFDLYKIGLQHHLFISNGRIKDNIFMNIAVCGAYAKEFKWAADFIEKYKQYLEPEKKENATAISKAYWHFYKKDFSTAIDFINCLEGKELNTDLRARSLGTRSYFELYLIDTTYLEMLLNYLDAFQRFITRKKILSQNKRNAYTNFISLTRKLTLAKNEKGVKKNFKKTKAQIKNLLQESKPLIAKSWLEEKMASL